MLLAPITIWCIWTTRCSRVFSAHKRPPAESIKLMWHTIITTLRAQYERIAGSDDAAELMRLNFLWPQQMEWIYNGSMKYLDGCSPLP